MSQVEDSPRVTRDDGLTEQEGWVADCLFEANTIFSHLPVEHEDDQREFEYHVHMLQGLLAVRIARRVFPDGWFNAQVDEPHPQGDPFDIVVS